MQSIIRKWGVLGVLLALLVLATPAGAQSRSVFWVRWDVRIDNVDVVANRFDVTERYVVHFNGTFRFGTRVIALTNLEDVYDIEVYEAGEPLQRECFDRAGTYCVEDTEEGRSIVYNFRQPITDDEQSFEIRYTVDGALRVYEGGDQLWWDAIPEEHYGFPINASRIDVILPNGYAPREGVDPIATYGAPATVEQRGERVIFTASRQIGGEEGLSVRVQFPHNPEARMAGWQPGFDQQRAFEANVRPIIDLVIGILGLAVAIGGSLLAFVQYQRAGRDPQGMPVPEYLSEPPSALPPAVVGTLLDETADLRDVMSTLVDLAHRGYIVIEENQKDGLFGIGKISEFVFKRTDKPLDGLRSFERRMMTKLFENGSMERSLDSLKHTFYTAIPRMQEELYREVVNEGLFRASPEQTRKKYQGGGALMVILGIFGAVLAVSVAARITPMLGCLPVAFIVPGTVLYIVGRHMPAKTRKGVHEAAKWRAFLTYLRNLEKYGDVGAAAQHFSAFLPYAVAFGIDRAWMRRFQGVEDVPVPTWYFPTYVGGPYGRGYTAGTPVGNWGGNGLPGELARADNGGLSLDNMSGRMSAGLTSMSAGLTTMLESASRVMSSAPPSSSSGGGGFSGGGFSGGGGSGGGSAGFG